MGMHELTGMQIIEWVVYNTSESVKKVYIVSK